MMYQVNEIVGFWKKFPPPHLLLRVMAQENRVWKPPVEAGQQDFMLPPVMMGKAMQNTKPLSKLPPAVAQMFADFKLGKIPRAHGE